ncbi:MAG: cell surface protein SprA, partial [Gemmatimonadales bacterium]|nr:cell surface protein SprA [Gemmatimonadales bacterium]
LEFWVLEDAQRQALEQNAYLVFDFGTVFEDAVGIAPQSFTTSGADTTFSGVQFVGIDRLDSEKDSVTSVFNAQVDDLGILGDRPDSLLNETTGEIFERFSLCNLQGLSGLAAFPLGDFAARCGHGNGYIDTEDLDGDNRLDTKVGTVEENLVRFVFPIGNEQYHVRDGQSLQDGAGRTLTWRLYRIPFRVDTIQVGRPNLRQIEAVRLTMVAPDQGGADLEKEIWLALTRMRLTGAPWVKRAETPLTGIAGNRGVGRGEVAASVVTTENTDLGYTPPPGVTNLPPSVDVGLSVGSVQINEKSLRLLATELREGERAEAFIRFTGEADRNFLNYRQLRLWARGRGAGWNEGDLEFFVKVGRDEHNFYLYRVGARTDTWEPELQVDIDRWLTLRSQVEARWLNGELPSGAETCGGDSTAYVACEGPYMVHVRDPGTAPPNLAAVSEVAVGMYRAGDTGPIELAELWVDDIRLVGVLDETGVAAALDVRLAAADVAELSVSLYRRDNTFRQLGEDPSYVTDAATRVGALFRLDKLLPESWGLSIPLSVQYGRTSANPFYVSRTDVRADALANLRNPGGSSTALQLSLRRVRRGTTFLARSFLDPWSVFAASDSRENVTSLSAVNARARSLRVAYGNTPGTRSTAGAPGFLVNLVSGLPAWLRESEFGRALRQSRLRWNPYQITFSSNMARSVAERYVYRVPVELASDSALRPLPSITHLWRNQVGLELRPYNSLSLSANYASTRDLQDYGDSTTVGKLLQLERRSLVGKDVGFERNRVLTTGFNVAPVVASWLRPRFSWATNYTFDRNPNRQDPVREEGDSAGAFRVPESLQNSRQQEVGASLDLARLAQGLAGDSGFVARLFRGFLPADLSYRSELRSGYDRTPFDADLGYQLGLGGIGDFRYQDGIPATSASRSTTTTMSGGLRLPLSLQVRLNYRNLATTSWQRRGGEQTEVVLSSREWPSMNVTWGYAPPTSVRKVLTSVTAQAQYRVQETARVQPLFGESAGGEAGSGQAARIENNTRLLSPSLTLGWWAGITTTARFTLARTEGITSGNVTESDRREWGATVNFAFQPPERLVRLPNRIQTTLAYSTSFLGVCIVRTGSAECRVVSDSRRNQFDFRMDTGFSSMLRGGLSFSYISSDQRHLSQRLRQYVFTLFGDITLRAGRLR